MSESRSPERAGRSQNAALPPPREGRASDGKIRRRVAVTTAVGRGGGSGRAEQGHAEADSAERRASRARAECLPPMLAEVHPAALPDGTPGELLSLLAAQASFQWQFVRHAQEGDAVRVSCPTVQDLRALMSMDGASVRGHRVDVKLYRYRGREATAGAFDYARLVRENYREDVAALDLSDWTCRQAEQPGRALSDADFLRALCDFLVQNAPDTVSLSLANNAIADLSPLAPLAALTKLKRLSLARNLLQDTRQLRVLASLGELVELQIAYNPLCRRRDAPLLVRAMAPGVRMLDGVAVPPLITLGVDPPAPPSLPASLPVSVWPREWTDGVRAFLDAYIRAYDGGNRKTLLGAYKTDCLYRCYGSAATLLAPLTRTSSSPNRTRTRTRERANNYDAITEFLSYPPTSHALSTIALDFSPVHRPPAPDCYILAFQGLVSVHLTSRVATRKFHRVFILSPSVADAWPFSISNDQLHLYGPPPPSH